MSFQIDPDKWQQSLLHLVTASIVESRSLQKLILQIISQGNTDTYNENIKRLREMYKEEYEKIKQQVYENYGLLPPGLFEE